MDIRIVLGVVVGIALLWAAVLVLFWFLRPKGVSVREVVCIVPDVARMLRSIVRDPACRSTCDSCSSVCWRGS
jgi:hypothetical protein